MSDVFFTLPRPLCKRTWLRKMCCWLECRRFPLWPRSNFMVCNICWKFRFCCDLFDGRILFTGCVKHLPRSAGIKVITLITYANSSQCMDWVISGICDFVCLCVCLSSLIEKRLELSTLNWVHIRQFLSMH